MKLKAEISIEIDADDYIAAADHQRSVEMLFGNLEVTTADRIEHLVYAIISKLLSVGGRLCGFEQQIGNQSR